MQDAINVINKVELFMLLIVLGQLTQAIETHVKAVIVPIAWDIIKAGGTMIDKGLNVSEFNFMNWDISNRPIIKMICLAFIVGFSLLEIRIKIPQNSSISIKVMSHEVIISIFNNG